MSKYDKASLVHIPSGYKSGTLYNVLPNDADGDFNFTRASTATRVDENGLIETIAIGTPRLNYPLLDGVVQDNPTLLLEPQRTNYLPYSEDFSNAAWTKFAAGTASVPVVTANYAISPDGSQNASRVQFDKGTGTGASNQSIISDTVTVTSGLTTNKSIFVKSNTSEEYDMVLYGSTDATGTNVAKIRITNQWQRFDVFGTIASTSTGLSFGLREISVTGLSNTADVLIWGAQIENGSYATSYIPSLTGSQTTRSADAANGAGTADDFNNTEGVFFSQISRFGTPTTNEYWLISINDNSGQNLATIGFNQTYGNLFGRLKAANSTQFQNTSTSSAIGLSYKLAIRYSSTEAAFFIDGFKKQTISNPTAFTGTLSRLDFSFGGGSSRFYGNTKEVIAFNEALSDTELEALTSYDSFNSMATELLFTIE